MEVECHWMLSSGFGDQASWWPYQSNGRNLMGIPNMTRNLRNEHNKKLIFICLWMHRSLKINGATLSRRTGRFILKLIIYSWLNTNYMDVDNMSVGSFLQPFNKSIRIYRNTILNTMSITNTFVSVTYNSILRSDMYSSTCLISWPCYYHMYRWNPAEKLASIGAKYFYSIL